MDDLTASLKLSRRGATLILGLRACCYLALAQYLAGDYLGMADALGSWRDDAILDGRSRTYAMLWRPLLVEGLIGSGQAEQAAAVLDRMRAENGQIGYLQPALAWLDGWLAEQRGDPEEALRIYQRGEEGAEVGSPVRRSSPGPTRSWRRAVFPVTRPAKQQPALALTSRETEVAHLVGKGLSNPEIAAELFISRKAVEYHLGNIYAKGGLAGRQELRRFVAQWRQPAAV